MTARLALIVGALVSLALAASAHADPHARAAATCSDYDNQAEAQRQADTRDADGDGIYCEALPCPCSRPGGSGGEDSEPRRRRPRKRAQTILARVTSVVDGDTIKVRAYRPRRRSYTVRLIGIDTPETRKPGTPVECGGSDATRSMKALAKRRAKVKLRTDPTQDTTDRYGRLLAYVYRGRRQLNVTQISKGWSKTYVYGGRRFQQYSRFRRAERSARRRDRGVWGECGGDFHRASRSGASQGDTADRTLFIRASSRGVSSLGGLRPRTDPTFAAAIRVFGEPSSARPQFRGSSCVVRWSDIGLTIEFAFFGADPDGGDACTPEFGRAQSAVIKGRAASDWRTARRLRIGHSHRQIRRRHRRATRHRNGWWLHTGRSQIGDCPARGCPYAVVRAKVSRGRVSSFRIFIGAAGD